MQVTRGFVRQISRSLARCELLHLPRQTFDVALAARQHELYIAALESAGVAVTVLPENPDLPDATFVEDTMVVLDEVVIACRLGAASRELETQQNLAAINFTQPVHPITSPGTLEGGDVLRLGKKLFVGLSHRTNRAGIEQLRQITTPFGYETTAATVSDCLHLKTGVTSPAPGLLIANPAWLDLSPFTDHEVIPVPTSEPWGANTLPVNGRVFITASAPRTAALLTARNVSVQTIDVSEIQKAEAGLTCLSVLH